MELAKALLWITGAIVLCHVLYTVFFPNRWKRGLKEAVKGSGLENAPDETYESVRVGSVSEWSLVASVCFILAYYL